MKIHGSKVTRPKEEVIVFPRNEGENLVFKAQAVLDYEVFDKLCPVPVAPEILFKGGAKKQDVKNPKFLELLDEYADRRTSWMIMESLKATPGLEWETVDESEPDTWKNFRTELEEAGISGLEGSLLVDLVTRACGLSQKKIDEATESFLADQAAQSGIDSSLNSEQESTPSGKLANDSN